MFLDPNCLSSKPFLIDGHKLYAVVVIATGFFIVTNQSAIFQRHLAQHYCQPAMRLSI